MFKLYLTSILVAEVVALAALEFLQPGLVRFSILVPIIPLTLIVAFIFRRRFGGPAYRLHRLSPQAITDYRATGPVTNSPETLSRAIVERAEEIQHALDASLLRRARLRRSRKRAIDALAEARKALPPGALRTAPQERQ